MQYYVEARDAASNWRRAPDTTSVPSSSYSISVTAVGLPGTPANPSPAAGATGVAATVALSWTGGSAATSHDVYFGTSSNPPFVSNTTGVAYTPGVLATGTTYYWRAVARNSAGSTSSATWSFTTVSGPGTLLTTSLSSGVAALFSLPSQNGSTVLYTGDFGFSISVPSGTTQLEVRMQASRDVDLFVNYGSESLLDPSAPNGVRADYRSITDFSFESIVISSPRAGTYYIAIGNFFRVSPPVTGTVTATVTGSAAAALQFVPITPCRVADTRNAPGTFGQPAVAALAERSFPVPQSSCGIPATAAAYSLNVTVVPRGPLGYLTIWPTGFAVYYPYELRIPTWEVAVAVLVIAATTG